MSDFNSEHLSALKAYTALSHTLGARADYVQGGGGNTSVKLDGRLMAIKASGYCLCDVTPESGYAVLDHQDVAAFYNNTDPASLSDIEKEGSACAKAAIRPVEGLVALRPSVEAGFHSLLGTYVAHTHSVYANLACCAVGGRELIGEALSGTDIVWGFIPYIDPGAKLTFAIRDEMRRVEQAAGKAPAVLFLQNHGIIAHDADPAACTALHERVNALLAARFGLTFAEYPTDGAFLRRALASGRFSDERLLKEPLYPDQMVYLTGSLGETIHIDYATGEVVCDQPKTAKVTMETLTAIAFIITTIEKNGFTVSTMGEAARAFIANWESEKYRKGIAEK